MTVPDLPSSTATALKRLFRNVPCPHVENRSDVSFGGGAELDINRALLSLSVMWMILSSSESVVRSVSFVDIEFLESVIALVHLVALGHINTRLVRCPILVNVSNKAHFVPTSDLTVIWNGTGHDCGVGATYILRRVDSLDPKPLPLILFKCDESSQGS